MDTDPASDVQKRLERDRPTPLPERLELICRRMDTAREEAAAGIRLRHPEYDEDQVRWALFRSYLRDDDLFHEIWPEAPLLDP